MIVDFGSKCSKLDQFPVWGRFMSEPIDDPKLRQAEENAKLTAWFNHLLQTIGRKDKEIAAFLQVPHSTIYKIKTGQQKLTAAQTIRLMQAFHVPLPLLASAHGERRGAEQTSKVSVKVLIDKELFAIAHEQVKRKNLDLPEDQRLSTQELLDETLFVYETLKG